MHFTMTSTDRPTPRALPLAAIRVFVETARLLSFRRAAARLGMTQSGVSHHIAALEAYLGRRLFVRAGHSVGLSNEGRRYFETIQEAVSTIELATHQLAQQGEAAGRLIVRTSLPTFAMSVLIPALPEFRRQTGAGVDVVTSLSPPALEDAFDVLVSRDLSVEASEQWHLVSEELACVAAPALYAEYADRPPTDRPFIAARSRPEVLIAWSQQMGIETHELQIASLFDHYFLAVPAALGGIGYLIVPRQLVAAPLRQGLLIEDERLAARGSARYTAYINPKSAAHPLAQTFCRWLKSELQRPLPDVGRTPGRPT